MTPQQALYLITGRLSKPNIDPAMINWDFVHENWTGPKCYETSEATLLNTPKGIIFVLTQKWVSILPDYYVATTLLHGSKIPNIYRISQDTYHALMQFPEYSPPGSTDFGLDEIAAAQELIDKLAG